jgi:uncharacterized protein
MPFLDVERLKKVKGERKRVSFDSDLSPIPVDDNEINLLKPAHFDLTLTNVGNAITVEGSFTVDLEVQCGRCLGNFVLSLSPDFSETYYDRSQPVPGPLKEDWISFSGDTIDITPEVENAIVLNLPMRFVCSEQCRGLCPVCGTDLNKKQCDCVQENIDLRMAKLKELLK